MEKCRHIFAFPSNGAAMQCWAEAALKMAESVLQLATDRETVAQMEPQDKSDSTRSHPDSNFIRLMKVLLMQRAPYKLAVSVTRSPRGTK
jgi:hypothetical protein